MICCSAGTEQAKREVHLPPRLRRSGQFAWQLTKHWLRGGGEQEEEHEQEVEAGEVSHLLVVHWARPPLEQVQLLQSFLHLSPT